MNLPCGLIARVSTHYCNCYHCRLATGMGVGAPSPAFARPRPIASAPGPPKGSAILPVAQRDAVGAELPIRGRLPLPFPSHILNIRHKDFAPPALLSAASKERAVDDGLQGDTGRREGHGCEREHGWAEPTRTRTRSSPDFSWWKTIGVSKRISQSLNALLSVVRLGW